MVESTSDKLGELAAQAGSAAKMVIQAAANVTQSLPIVGAAATVLLQLIDVCDAHRCNKSAFTALKQRMEGVYKLYFAKDGEPNYRSVISCK